MLISRIKPAPGPIETITLPFEEFDKASSACYALMKLSAQQLKNGVATLVSVPAIKINGILLTGMGGSYHGLESQFDAWELSPEETYQGPTTAFYHDEDAIKAGLRNRGDHTGLVVKYRGSRMVLTRKISVKAGAPSLKYAVSLVDAKSYDATEGNMGWRDQYDGAIQWIEKEGFVFAVYVSKHPAKDLTILFYRNARGYIKDVFVKDIESFCSQCPNPGTIDMAGGTPKARQPRRKPSEDDPVVKKLIEALRALS